MLYEHKDTKDPMRNKKVTGLRFLMLYILNVVIKKYSDEFRSNVMCPIQMKRESFNCRKQDCQKQKTETPSQSFSKASVLHLHVIKSNSSKGLFQVNHKKRIYQKRESTHQWTKNKVHQPVQPQKTNQSCPNNKISVDSCVGSINLTHFTWMTCKRSRNQKKSLCRKSPPKKTHFNVRNQDFIQDFRSCKEKQVHVGNKDWNSSSKYGSV